MGRRPHPRTLRASWSLLGMSAPGRAGARDGMGTSRTHRTGLRRGQRPTTSKLHLCPRGLSLPRSQAFRNACPIDRGCTGPGRRHSGVAGRFGRIWRAPPSTKTLTAEHWPWVLAVPLEFEVITSALRDTSTSFSVMWSCVWQGATNSLRAVQRRRSAFGAGGLSFEWPPATCASELYGVEAGRLQRPRDRDPRPCAGAGCGWRRDETVSVLYSQCEPTAWRPFDETH